MTKQDIIRNYSSLALAYIGDAVYELRVREYILGTGIVVNGKMHNEVKKYVSAYAQNEILTKISAHLTDDEADVVRRGRNSNPHSHPKNTDLACYHNATGFEALWGYLHLAKDFERMDFLFDIITDTMAK